MKGDAFTTVVKSAQAARLARSNLREAIIEARAAGLTLTEIARGAGISKQRVHQITTEEASGDA